MSARHTSRAQTVSSRLKLSLRQLRGNSFLSAASCWYRSDRLDCVSAHYLPHTGNVREVCARPHYISFLVVQILHSLNICLMPNLQIILPYLTLIVLSLWVCSYKATHASNEWLAWVFPHIAAVFHRAEQADRSSYCCAFMNLWLSAEASCRHTDL